jgi:hypothetical protein
VGEGWLWYRNGIERVATGQPLYKPEWQAGPYDYTSPEKDKQFNQVPWLLPIVAPIAVLPEPVARYAWLIITDAALALALALSLGRRPTCRLPVLLALLLWAPTLMCLVWGNVENIVILGFVLWFVGHRRRSRRIETAGIVLASLKIVPAIPLVLFSLKEARWSSVVGAALAVALMTVPAILTDGPQVIPVFVTITGNIMQIVNSTGRLVRRVRSIAEQPSSDWRVVFNEDDTAPTSSWTTVVA